MPKKTSKNTAKKYPRRGRGCERKEDPTPSLTSSPSDGDDAGSNASRASSMASVAASMTSNTSQSTPTKKKRAKRTQFCLDVQEEQLMCEFLRENAFLLDIKKTDYRRVDKKAKL